MMLVLGERLQVVEKVLEKHRAMQPLQLEKGHEILKTN